MFLSAGDTVGRAAVDLLERAMRALPDGDGAWRARVMGQYAAAVATDRSGGGPRSHARRSRWRAASAIGTHSSM